MVRRGRGSGDVRVTEPPVASHRDLYLLIVGLLVGLILGPILSRLRPDLHTDAFVGGRQQAQLLVALDQRHQEQAQRLAATGVTPAAIEELRQSVERERLPLLALGEQEQRRKLDNLSALALTLALAFAAVMIVEAVIDPARAVARANLATGRYALLAALLALLLVQPRLVAGVSPLFLLLLILLTLAACLVPLKARNAH